MAAGLCFCCQVSTGTESCGRQWGEHSRRAVASGHQSRGGTATKASVLLRLRLAPQIAAQPTHPVRQYITGQSEMCGDLSIVPAIYNPALQDRAVVWG